MQNKKTRKQPVKIGDPRYFSHVWNGISIVGENMVEKAIGEKQVKAKRSDLLDWLLAIDACLAENNKRLDGKTRVSYKFM